MSKGDFQEPGVFGRGYRLYSYGHVLFRFFEGARQSMLGEYAGIVCRLGEIGQGISGI